MTCACGAELPPKKTKPKRTCDACYRKIRNARGRETYAFYKAVLGHPKYRSWR